MTLLSPGQIPCKTREQPPASCRAVAVSTKLMHYVPRTAALYRKEAAACQSNPNEAIAYCRASVYASPIHTRSSFFNLSKVHLATRTIRKLSVVYLSRLEILGCTDPGVLHAQSITPMMPCRFEPRIWRDTNTSLLFTVAPVIWEG